MTNSKTTRKALLSSALALTMCVAMLIATTFAWFTDTASTSVNKIQAGTLDVELQMANEWKDDGSVKTWVNAEGETLQFRKAAEADKAEAVLWEPGCTYKLPELRVVNNGNLALKYEIKITGIDGDAKLNEAIKWTLNGEDIGNNIGELLAGKTSDAMTIKGHMKEDAGNEYQGLSIDGIAITVYATQLASEFDSQNNTYDGGAFDALKSLYPVSNTAAVTRDAEGKVSVDNVVVSNAKTEESGTTGKTYSVSVPAAAIADGVDNISVSINKSADVNSKFTIKSDADTTVQQFDVKVTGIKAENNTEIGVEMFIGKGYNFENADNLTVEHLKSSDKTVEKINGAKYNKDTGFVTFKTTSFSPFAVATPNVDAVIGTGENTTYYAGLTEAVAAGGEITLLRDVKLTKTIEMKKDENLNVTINGGNYKVECPGDGVFDITKGTLTINSGSYHDTETTKRIYGAVYAYGTAVVNINGGTFNGGKQTDGQQAPVCVFAGNTATVNITDGTFTNDDCSTVIYAGDNGKINISGGFFEAKYNEKYKRYYALNKINGSNATITVTGGTFVNYDPSTGDDAGNPANFVSSGYKVTSKAQSNGDIWYTVDKNTTD